MLLIITAIRHHKKPRRRGQRERHQTGLMSTKWLYTDNLTCVINFDSFLCHSPDMSNMKLIDSKMIGDEDQQYSGRKVAIHVHQIQSESEIV